MLNELFFKRHLEDDEVVRVYVHRHWLLGMKTLFWPSVSFLASWFVLYAAPFRTVFYAVVLWSVLSVVWWCRNFLDYYLDAWLITNHGIIDVKWYGWFHRQSKRLLYSDVQGVSYEIKGVGGTILRYGDVSVEKVSTGGIIALDAVPSPRLVETAILQNMEEYLHMKNLSDAKHVQEVLSNVISRELHLKQLEGMKPVPARKQK
ncbi:MAG: PH domain-containing protein [Candidatus Peribacteraceae bacterium]|nr:PH domain-containing protein [Candidatus Peribacteraceae bacterium]